MSTAGWRRAVGVLLVAVVGAGLWAVWSLTAVSVMVEVDGYSQAVRTHRRDVGSLLFDLGFETGPNDRLSPPAETSTKGVTTVSLARAIPYRISIDGHVVEVGSRGVTVGDVLQDAGLAVDPYDTVVIDDRRVSLDDPVPRPEGSRRVSAFHQTYPRAAWAGTRMEPYRIRVSRAATITVDDGTMPYDIRTTAQTVGEALREQEITIYLGDVVVPSLGSQVLPGMRVSVQRSRPISFRVDGRLVKTRTRSNTVADALVEAQIGLSSMDLVTPELDASLDGVEQVSVVRLLEDIEVEEEIAPFATVYVPDVNLPIDTQQLITPGAEGITRTRFRVRYEDGEEVERKLEDRWTAQEPAERSIAYGQRIDPKSFTAPDGTEYTYWRKIRMLASSYSAGTAGVSPDKAYYGRTYTGDVMRHGIVAVDPSVVPLRSKVYVTGYGEGDALDMGSVIIARRIDLGYDDDNLVLWNKWVEVYLLWPPPPAHQITWVLPNWPKPPQ